MSTNVTREKPVASPSRGLGLAAAGLAIVVAIGIGFTLSEDNAASHSDVQPAQVQVSESGRVKVEMNAQREAATPKERQVRLAKDQSHRTGNGEVAGG